MSPSHSILFRRRSIAAPTDLDAWFRKNDKGVLELNDKQRWVTLAVGIHHRLAHHRRGVALLVYASLILVATTWPRRSRSAWT